MGEGLLFGAVDTSGESDLGGIGLEIKKSGKVGGIPYLVNITNSIV